MMKIDLPIYIEVAIKKLEEKKFEAYLVGGAIRDFLLGKIPNDYDIATNAELDEIIAVFSEYKIIETA